MSDYLMIMSYAIHCGRNNIGFEIFRFLYARSYTATERITHEAYDAAIEELECLTQ